MNASKLLKYGAVCFVPSTSFDAVSGSGTYQGQTIALLEPSDELPGFLGWFTIAGLPDPGLSATDTSVSTNEPTQVQI